ncbi:lysosomal cholesterol signaling protein-like [Brevipalpus obovatus]|uniref:lysosomal cholesterol signaling protein-like n=1 Tax=Brevipalpus obovatus TaxID=246614 RepID=UPI003D9E8752
MNEITEIPLNLLTGQSLDSPVLQLSSILLQCFALIVIGYAAGRFDVINAKESDGLANFVSYFSLPALIFLSLARCDFSQIDWYFVASVFIAKTFIFIGVIVVTLIITKTRSIGKAGLYGLFVTQSNDFAIGYPLFISLYQSDHPNFPDYLYVIAPLQLVLISPCGIFMMELDKYRTENQSSKIPTSALKIIVQVSKRTFLNPVIVMTLGGIAWNIFFGPKVPIMMGGFLQSLSDAFAPTSLFLLGLNIVQEAGAIKGFSKFLIPSTLSAVKLIICPLLLRTVCQHLLQGDEAHVTALSNFGFLYGIIPSAPTAAIFAITYGLGSWIMSSGLIISTVISAPLLFVSASLLRSPESRVEQFEQNLLQSIEVISLISIPCVLWTLIIFICGRKWTSVTHRITFLLLLSQTILAISSYSIQLEVSQPTWYHLVPIFAVFMSRFLVTIISLTLAAIHQRTLLQIMKFQDVCLLTSLIISTCLVIIIYIMSPRSPAATADHEFPFGFAQAIMSMAALFVNIVVTGLAIIVQQRFQSSLESFQRMSDDTELNDKSSIVSSEKSIWDELNEEMMSVGLSDQFNGLKSYETHHNGSPDSVGYIDIREIERGSIDQSSTQSNLIRVKKQPPKSCINSIWCYWKDLRRASIAFDNNTKSVSFYSYIQINLHTALLLLLELSMIIGFVCSLSKAMGERISGIYKELIFLDIFLCHGQAIFSFVLFGLDFTPIIDLWRCFNSKYNSLKFVNKQCNESSEETMHLCQQFYTYHRDKCSADICFPITHDCIEISVFRGRDLIRWLIESGLTVDRKTAEIYSASLFKEQIFKHLDGCSHFSNTTSLYRFIDEWPFSSIKY